MMAHLRHSVDLLSCRRHAAPPTRRSAFPMLVRCRPTWPDRVAAPVSAKKKTENILDIYFIESIVALKIYNFVKKSPKTMK